MYILRSVNDRNKRFSIGIRVGKGIRPTLRLDAFTNYAYTEHNELHFISDRALLGKISQSEEIAG